MQRLTWLEFRALAYPSEAAIAEANRDVVYRAHRSVGLWLAFLFYRIGFTGNLLSVLRFVMSIGGAFLMIRLVTGDVLWPFIGALLIYGQVVLDFSDGALGRLTPGNPSQLGFQFDILGCDVGRIVMAVVLGSYTGSIAMILIGVSATYILATFRTAVVEYVPGSAVFRALKWVTRWMTSDQFVVVLLPFVLIGIRLLSELFLVLMAFAIVIADVILAMAWTLGMVPVRCSSGAATR